MDLSERSRRDQRRRAAKQSLRSYLEDSVSPVESWEVCLSSADLARALSAKAEHLYCYGDEDSAPFVASSAAEGYIVLGGAARASFIAPRSAVTIIVIDESHVRISSPEQTGIQLCGRATALISNAAGHIYVQDQASLTIAQSPTATVEVLDEAKVSASNVDKVTVRHNGQLSGGNIRTVALFDQSVLASIDPDARIIISRAASPVLPALASERPVTLVGADGQQETVRYSQYLRRIRGAA